MTSIENVLTRGVAEVIHKENLRKKLHGGERLRIKLGIDPTSPDLHIGRAVSLLKLRDFQELGHHIVLIVGDFTAVIGDTSDKDAERPMLTRETIEKNKKTYFEQVGKIIDLSQAELRYNSEWLAPLNYRQIGEHADLFSVADFIARENIKLRLDTGKRVSLREVLYPLMQGYDSVAIEADVELGGTDQRFNLLAGRTMQENMGQRPQDIVMNPLIEGTDGRKMSSSWGNVITLTMEPAEMYGKVMSMGDEQLPAYFELCTRVPMEEVKKILEGHPKQAKMRLAEEIVSMYHGGEAAAKAQNNWNKTFSQKEITEEVTTPALFNAGQSYIDALVYSQIVLSRTEVRRLASAGAIFSATRNVSISDPTQQPQDGEIVKIGKHRFAKMVLNK